MTFNGIHKIYTNYGSYTFKQNEVLMDKPIFLGFTILELLKSLFYGTYYGKLQTYFGEKFYNYILWILIFSYKV